MFKLDNAFLEELGLGSLPPVEKNKMLAHIYETLEMRVGMKLAEQMSNEQLDEFESYINAQDEAGALKWLETNFPNYKQVVADQLESLKLEIKQVAPQIVQQSIEAQSHSQQSQNFQPQQQQMPPQPPQTAPAPQQPISYQQQTQTPAPPANFDPVAQPGSEPLANTNGANFVPQGTSQGSTTGQQPQQHPAVQPNPQPPQQPPVQSQPWQPE